MQELAYIKNVEAEELLGEWHPLVEQLGSSEGLLTLGTATEALRLPRVGNAAQLESFLESYKAHLLIPKELPAILRSYRHATRNETRELIAFDQALTRQPQAEELARASRRAGQYQLKRLSPLRDHRLLQRYLLAVDEKRAQGWHTLVYGITLSIYSMPVLQGLVFYERQTLRGFIEAAARRLQLRQIECRCILARLCADIPERLDRLGGVRAGTVVRPR